jgi:hypothetical protein
MTGNRILQNMITDNTMDYDQEQLTKIRTEIEFYIKEELEDYFNEFWETSNKDC